MKRRSGENKPDDACSGAVGIFGALDGLDVTIKQRDYNGTSGRLIL